MQLAARYIPLVHVWLSLASYTIGVLASRGNCLWPSAIASEYPSRPLYQIGNACDILPHITLTFLWILKTRSRTIAFTGCAKFLFWLLPSYVTRNDSAETHGVLSFLQTVSTAGWMLAIHFRARKANQTVSKYRRNILIGYIFTFFLSLHQLSKFLTTGFGMEEFMTLRGVGLLLEIGFEYLGKDEFNSMELAVQWTQTFTA